MQLLTTFNLTHFYTTCVLRQQHEKLGKGSASKVFFASSKLERYYRIICGFAEITFNIICVTISSYSNKQCYQAINSKKTCTVVIYGNISFVDLVLRVTFIISKDKSLSLFICLKRTWKNLKSSQKWRCMYTCVSEK